MFRLIGLFLSLAGVTLLATRLLPAPQRSLSPDLNAASLIIVAAFVIYAEVLALGHLDWLTAQGLVLVNGLLALALWSTWRAALADVRMVVQRLGLAFRDCPWLLLPVFFPLLVSAATPWQDGDTYAYHLPNLLHLLQQGTTHTAAAGALFDPGAATSYYPRGLEACGAFFYFFALPHVTLLAFKSLVFAVLLLLFRAQQPEGLGATFVFAVGASWFVIQNDLGSLKNDVFLAVCFLYAYCVVTRTAWRQPRLMLPVAMALALCLGLKSNALMYVAAVSLCWLGRAGPRCGRPLLLLMLVTLPWGLYFPLLNWWEHGSPFHPHGWQCLGRTIFPGAVLPGFDTTLGGHLDGAALLLLLRGLLRQAGPVGGLLLVLGPGWLLGRWIRRPAAPPRAIPRIMDYGALALCVVFFLLTPYSDNNNGVPHHQLFSGHSLRMVLPALGLLGLMVVEAWPVAWRWRRPGLVFALALGLLLNGVAYDLTAMLLKPQNAWAQMAPLPGSFHNGALTLVALMLAGLAVWACRCWRPPWLAALLVVAGVYQSLTWPASLGYALRFKQSGERSQAFAWVQTAVRADDTVSLWADKAGNYFCGCMYAVVAPRARAVHLRQTMAPAPRTSLVIQCADDVEQSKALVTGRTYQNQRQDIASRMISWGYAELYRDACYSVWRKSPALVKNKVLPGFPCEY